ncbi:hypothetical protein HYQ46_004631 [Verticillium longisporum]|nr:hypothetical protein HYQ46_004631 [Verticillium longisporum]
MNVVFLRDARFVVGGRKRRFDHKLRRGREEDAMSGSQLSTQSLEMSRLAERAGPRVPGDDYSGASAPISMPKRGEPGPGPPYVKGRERRGAQVVTGAGAGAAQAQARHARGGTQASLDVAEPAKHNGTGL